MRLNRIGELRSGSLGLLVGAGLTLTYAHLTELTRQAAPVEVMPIATLQQYEPSDYFVTGDSSVATLWRRERNGTLTCISVNQCRRPSGE